MQYHPRTSPSDYEDYDTLMLTLKIPSNVALALRSYVGQEKRKRPNRPNYTVNTAIQELITDGLVRAGLLEPTPEPEPAQPKPVKPMTEAQREHEETARRATAATVQARKATQNPLKVYSKKLDGGEAD